MSVQPSGGQALFPEAVNNNSTQQTQSKAQPSGGPSQPQNQKSASAQSHAQGAAKPGADSSLKFDVMIFKEVCLLIILFGFKKLIMTVWKCYW